MWTVVLLTVGLAGIWTAAKHWWGWVIGAAAEILWMAYAMHIGATPLLFMAMVWFAVDVRNAVVTRRAAA